MNRRWFQSLSSRLQLLAGLSAAVALVVAGTVFVWHDFETLNLAKERQLQHFAGLLSLNSQRALSTGDADEAERLLQSLRLDPTVIAACLYDVRGEIVASYFRDSLSSSGFPPPDDHGWTRPWGENELAVYRRIFLGPRRVGALFLRAATDDIRQQLDSYSRVALGAVVVSLLAAGLFAHLLQATLSRPIESLLEASNRVTRDGDYTVRVERQGEGDLSDLCDAFNAMLARVEASDAALHQATRQLDSRVRERTKDLHREVIERRHAESIVNGQNRVLQQLASGLPLPEVLATLVSELETHLRSAYLAIVEVDEARQQLGAPIAVTLHTRISRDLDHASISTAGNAAARAAATHLAHYDRGVGVGGDPEGCFAKSVWALPVLSSDGAPLAVVVAYQRDDRLPTIDELTLLEAAVSLAGVAIEQRRGESALTRAMQRATSANRAKSAFLANMSHEIRTPLNAILGFADLMLGDAERLDPEHREHLTTILSSGRHLLALINDILDLSKIEAGQVEVESIRTDPSATLAEVMSLLRVRAREKGIDLECRWETPAPETIESDPARLRQLLVNLVGNAIKFTEKGAVIVSAAVERSGDADFLRVDVVDTGIGIPVDKLEAIFEPFVQADSSVTRRFGGTGLGLAISRRLARALGGDLSVESVFGQGSRFTLRISAGSLLGVPLHASPLGDSLLGRRPSGDPDGAGATRLEGLRVLIVDDGETNRRLLSIVLRRAGVEVEVAEDGQQGVEAALACPFDAILMDMQMPVLDGYSAVRRLRKEGLATPIIAITAHAMKGDAEKCFEAGCTAYLTKPIEAPRLMAELSRLCDASQPGGEVADRHAKDGPPEGPIYSTLPTDDEEFRDVVVEFIAKVRDADETMRGLAAEGDWGALRERAHWLKGTGGVAGFALLSRLAAELEDALRGDPEPSLVAARIGQVGALCERLEVSPLSPLEA